MVNGAAWLGQCTHTVENLSSARPPEISIAEPRTDRRALTAKSELIRKTKNEKRWALNEAPAGVHSHASLSQYARIVHGPVVSTPLPLLMPRRSVSRDIKDRIPVLRFEQGRSVEEICTILGVKKSLVYATLEYHHKYGVLYNPLARKSGRHRRVSGIIIPHIRSLLEERPTVYADEIQEYLAKDHSLHVSIRAVLRTLRRMHWSSKAVTKIAKERNDELRADFCAYMATLVTNPAQLMFGDESAVDGRTSARRRGWAPIGMRCVQRTCFVRGKRYSLLPILTLDGLITWKIFEGSVTSEMFVEFLRECVVCSITHILVIFTDIRVDTIHIALSGT